MKIWFDTEFIESHRHIEPLSIGLVREDGETYYAEFQDANLEHANLWVMQNVLPHLTGAPEHVKSKHQIAGELVEFCKPWPEFWAYYADYDWVILCQLYGGMLQVPNTWPHFCLDLQQVRHLSPYRGPLPDIQGERHHALADAQWCKAAHEYLGRMSS